MNKKVNAQDLVHSDMDGLQRRLQPLGIPQPTVVKTFELGAHHLQFRSGLRPLLNKVRNALARGMGTVLHLTSPISGEGVSTVARELVSAAAGISYCRSLLLDFNQAEGGQGAVLGGTLPGVVSAYMARGSVEVAAVSVGGGTFHIAEFDVASFDAFTLRAEDAGTKSVDGDQEPLLSIEEAPERPRTMADLYSSLCGAYNLVVVDCPPVQEPPYFVPLSHDTPDVILVVRAEQTRIPVVMRAKDEILALGGGWSAS